MASTVDTPYASDTSAPAELPPGPRWPAALQTLAWVLAPHRVMDHCVARLGDAFTITLAPSGRHIVVFADPDAARTIFTAPPHVAPSATGSTPIASVMGPSSVLTLIGPAHLRQRKLLLPPFHGERMREYVQVIEHATTHNMASWPLGRPMRLHPRMQAITLEVILRAVFGVEAERMETLRRAIIALTASARAEAVRVIVRSDFGGRPQGRLGRQLDELDALIYGEIRRRRAVSDLPRRTDILSMLLLARDEDGAAMTDDELRDELVTLLLAGHETTATAVSWAFERLVRHPQTLARLIDEVDGGGQEYLEAVIHETLRVRPVVPTVVRTLTEPLAIGGRTVPAGTRVVPAIYLVNRSPNVYDRPTEFRPERFLGRSPDTYTWIPFGGGIRRCIGASFALMEIKVIMRTVLRRLEPRLPARARQSGEPLRRRAVTLAPGRRTRVVWQPRAPRGPAPPVSAG